MISCRLCRRSTPELLVTEAIHLQRSAKAANLQPDIFPPKRISIRSAVSQIQADQLVEGPVQMEIVHVRRSLRGQRQASQMPFELGERRQVLQRPGSRMCAQVPGKGVAILGHAGSRRRMLANE